MKFYFCFILLSCFFPTFLFSQIDSFALFTSEYGHYEEYFLGQSAELKVIDTKVSPYREDCNLNLTGSSYKLALEKTEYDKLIRELSIIIAELSCDSELILSDSIPRCQNHRRITHYVPTKLQAFYKGIPTKIIVAYPRIDKDFWPDLIAFFNKIHKLKTSQEHKKWDCAEHNNPLIKWSEINGSDIWLFRYNGPSNSKSKIIQLDSALLIEIIDLINNGKRLNPFKLCNARISHGLCHHSTLRIKQFRPQVTNFNFKDGYIQYGFHSWRKIPRSLQVKLDAIFDKALQGA